MSFIGILARQFTVTNNIYSKHFLVIFNGRKLITVNLSAKTRETLPEQKDGNVLFGEWIVSVSAYRKSKTPEKYTLREFRPLPASQFLPSNFFKLDK